MITGFGTNRESLKPSLQGRGLGLVFACRPAGGNRLLLLPRVVAGQQPPQDFHENTFMAVTLNPKPLTQDNRIEFAVQTALFSEVRQGTVS